MTLLRKHLRLVSVGAVCAGAGVGAGAIATAGAAGSNPAGSSSSGATAAHAAAAPGARRALARRALARRAIQGEMVVATRTGFATVTLNRGFVQSVNGQQLTIREGTKTKTYKVVTITVPSSAKVRDNGHSATLSQLTAGQRVGVVQGPKVTRVVARTAS